LIGSHGVAITAVLFAADALSKGNLGGTVAFGALAGVIIFGLISWWSFKIVEPTSYHRLGNSLYLGGRDCAWLLVIAGVAFAVAFGWDNPFWGFVAPFMIVVFWLAALACWIVGRAFLYFLADR
jgi:hypothetical protein